MPAHGEIHELLTKANQHLDRRDWKSFAELFAPDAVLVTPSGKVARGRVELKQLLEENVQLARRHLAVNVDIAVEGARANATSYQLVLEAGREPSVLGGIYCVDLLKRVGKRWRFAARRMFEELPATASLFA
jgi:uncharacterized protein (TIGR02246 family)